MKKHVNTVPPKIRRVLLIIVIVAAVIAFIGITMHIIAKMQLRSATNEAAVLNVSVIKAAAPPSTEEIILPGNVQAWHEATVYARVDGYVKKWDTDIGAHVKAGDLLAEIEAPELDAQLRQAEADLKTAQANNQLAQSTAKRWKELLKSDSVSKQETDEKVAAAAANTTLVNAARANRDRLLELVHFKRVIAPFDGIITARTTDIGSLINAGSGTTLRSLFHIAQADPLRIYVRVPQNYSDNIKPGLVVEMHFAEHPGKIYSAKLLDTAKAIDPVSRTLLAQFEFSNKDYQILPGGYTEVHFQLPTESNIIKLPVNTVLFRAEGLRVGIIDANNKVVLKPIKIIRDFGDTVEVNGDLKAGESIIVNPSDSLFDGQQVHVVEVTKMDKGSQS